MLRSGAQQF
jgi:dynein heavy chain, axonemal